MTTTTTQTGGTMPTTDYQCSRCTYSTPNHRDAISHDRAHDMPIGYTFGYGTIFVFYGPSPIW